MEVNKRERGICRLIQGDCIEVMKKIPDNSIDFILTDPPYLISKKSNFDKGGSWNNSKKKEYRKTPPKTDFGEWDKKELNMDFLFYEYHRILKPHGTLLIFYDIWKINELKDWGGGNP